MPEAETKPKDSITESNTKEIKPVDANTVKEEKEASDREIAMYQKSQQEYMKKQIPFLEIQAKYTSLIASIDENHCRRVEAQIRYANIMASQNKIKAEAALKKQGQQTDAVDPKDPPPLLKKVTAETNADA